MCVEISNITNFINWTNQNQPYIVLHEPTHAYHHRVLNYNSPVITNAFNNVVSNNLYKNVSYQIISLKLPPMLSITKKNILQKLQKPISV